MNPFGPWQVVQLARPSRVCGMAGMAAGGWAVAWPVGGVPLTPLAGEAWHWVHWDVVNEAWLSGYGRTPPLPWQIVQSVRVSMGCGIGLGVPLPGTLGGATNSRMATAFSPANFQSAPWHALLEQKLELSVPPGLLTSWHCAQVSSNT